MKFNLRAVTYKKFIVVLLLITCMFTMYITFYNVGKAPLDNWDEAWYGAVTKHMFATRQFIVPYWNGIIYLDKPPLFMWIASIFSIIFGLSEFSLRLTSAISGFLIIIMATVYSYKRFGLIPAFATFSTIALNNIFIWRSRSANLDAFTAFLIFSCFFIMISKYKYRLLILGVIFACIYLTRASYVVFPLSIFALHEVLFRWREFFKNFFFYFLGMSIFLLICGSWLYLGYKQVGPVFTNYFIFGSDRDVAKISISTFNFAYVNYMYYALQRKFFFVFLLGFILLFKKIRKPEYFLLILFSSALLIFLSFAAKKNNWYLIPLTPFWSIVVGYAVYQIIQLFKKNKVVTFGIAAILLYISYKTYTQNIFPIINTTSAIGEAQSGIYLKNHTKKNEIIVRLDHLYPTLVYYSDRKVLVSPVDSNVTGTYFIDRKYLVLLIKEHTIHWLAGEKRDTDFFQKQHPEFTYTVIPTNPAEYILHITST